MVHSQHFPAFLYFEIVFSIGTRTFKQKMWHFEIFFSQLGTYYVRMYVCMYFDKFKYYAFMIKFQFKVFRST